MSAATPRSTRSGSRPVLRGLDLSLLRLLRTRGHSPSVEAAIARGSAIGEHGILWYALAALGALVDPGRRALYLRTMRAVLFAFVANQAVKLFVRRPRPRLDGLPPLTSTLSDRSYPSAHAATSFAAARTLPVPGPRAPLYALATVMALSRPYLGVHYPSDTVAGAALGDAVARLLP
jgi:membrane-associated phospholipid phosphatase